MGRGNVCTHNECEGLYYLDKDYIDAYINVTRCNCGHITGREDDAGYKTAKELSIAGIDYDFDGSNADWAYDEHSSSNNWREMISIVTDALLKRFKSFNRTDRWRNDKHIVLESELFEIAVADGEWCAAWCLLEREDVDGTDRSRTFMRKHFKSYLEAIKLILINGWGEAIGYGGAWTSGKRYTHEDVA